MRANRQCIAVFIMMLFSQLAFGQKRTITGTVKDESGATLPGVAIQVGGTSGGTVTNIDGEYSISIEKEKVQLTFSFIGFAEEKVQVTTQTKVDVVLKQQSENLEEYVVVGYGKMRKSDISAASVTVKAEDIKSAGLANVDQILQGRVAGVSAVHTSGQPGGAVSVRIRGQSTINAGAEPLYVIDGVPLTNTSTGAHSLGLSGLGNAPTSSVSALSNFDPNDVEHVETLKDAAATAIYGAQGANGVILITTKRGKKGKAKFSYNGSMGVRHQDTRIEMMNLQEFAEYSNSVAGETDGRDQRPEFQDPSLLGYGTDWQDAVFRLAEEQNHQVSVRGGGDKISYMVSGGYTNKEGTIIGTELERYNFRTNLDVELRKWLKMGVNVYLSQSDQRIGLVDSESGILRIALQTTPDMPIYNIDGSYATIFREGQTSRPNAIGMAMDDENTLGRNGIESTVFFDLSFSKDLVLHSEGTKKWSYSTAQMFRPSVVYGNWERPINTMRSQNNKNTFWQLKNFLTYSKKVKKHSTSLMVGHEMTESSWEYQSIYNTNLPSNAIQNPSLGDGEPQITSGFGSNSMASLFGRFNYNFDNRYMLTYIYRRDGSSNFGPENRWASFHSLAGSWRFTEEKFLEWLKPLISNGKLRASWGQAGNQNIGGYLWGASISKMDTGLGAGYRQANIANPYIQWETQEQLNLAAELTMFNEAVDLVVEVYDKTSADMLMPLQLPSYMGTRGNVSSALAAPWGNYGEINNQGLEISLTTHNFNREFKWDTDFQISFNRDKLVALDGTPSAHIEGYGQWSDVVSLTEIGDPLFGFYGYVTDGIYQNLDDLKNSPRPTKYPSDGESFEFGNTTYVGDVKYKDISGPNGKPDGVIDSFDRTNIGSPTPDFTVSLNNTFSYKNFDLSVYLYGHYGNEVMNYTAIDLSSMNSIWTNQLAEVKNRARLEPIDGNYDGEWWKNIANVRVANSGTDVPRAVSGDPNDNSRISDRYIEDGSFLRIKNITFGYTFPKRFVEKVHLSRLRAYSSIENLVTFTNYTGFDPEVGASTQSSSGNVYGLDNGRYPSPQIFTFGLNVSF